MLMEFRFRFRFLDSAFATKHIENNFLFHEIDQYGYKTIIKILVRNQSKNL